jgi:hypothetical protein
MTDDVLHSSSVQDIDVDRCPPAMVASLRQMMHGLAASRAAAWMFGSHGLVLTVAQALVAGQLRRRVQLQQAAAAHRHQHRHQVSSTSLSVLLSQWLNSGLDFMGCGSLHVPLKSAACCSQHTGLDYPFQPGGMQWSGHCARGMSAAQLLQSAEVILKLPTCSTAIMSCCWPWRRLQSRLRRAGNRMSACNFVPSNATARCSATAGCRFSEYFRRRDDAFKRLE